jgi:hypothetical protein
MATYPETNNKAGPVTDIHSQNKQLLAPLRAAQQNFDATQVQQQLDSILAPDCVVHLFHPWAI